MSARMKCMQSFLVLLLLRAVPAVKIGSALSARAQHAAFLLTEQETGHPVAQVVQTIQATAVQAQAAGKQEQALMQKAQADNAKAETTAAAGIQQTQEQIQNGQDQLAAGKAEAEALTDGAEAGAAGVAQQTAAAQAAAADRAQVVAAENAVAANSAATVGAMTGALGSLNNASALSAGSKVNGDEENGGKVNGGKVNGGFLQMEDPWLKHAQDAVQQLLLMPLVMQDISEDEEIDMLDFAGDTTSTTQSPLTGAAPTAKPYQSKLGKVMNLIKKLMHKLEDKQHKADMAAMQTKTEYELAKGARDEALKVAEEALAEKNKLLAETTGSNTKLQSEIDANKAELSADTKGLKDRQAYFAMKMEEFKERNYMRKRELEAMAFGVKILQQVAGVRKPTSSMLQLETSGHLIKMNDMKAKAVISLRAEALRVGDFDLQRLADQLEATLADDGVGKKVDLMLQQKIWALDDEQLKDDEKKAWCDQEINKTETNTAFKAADLKTLDDTSETLAADVASLLEDIKTATGVVGEKKTQMHKDRLEREETGDEAKNTIHDAQRAQEALKKGIGVIQKFYQDAKDRAESASLIQTRYSLDLDADPAVPFDGSFTGTSTSDGKGPGEKILEILEETQADFAQMEAETKAQDSADGAKFAENVKDAKTELAARNSELELKTQEKTRLWEKLTQTKDDMRLTDRQKAALGVYLKDLNKECDYAMFAERQANRTREKLSLNVSRVTLADAFNHSDVNASSNATTSLAEQASPASLAKEAAAGPASKQPATLVPRSGRAGAVDWVIPDARQPQIEDTFEAMDEANASSGAFLRMPSQQPGTPPFRLLAAERPEWKTTPEQAVPPPP